MKPSRPTSLGPMGAAQHLLPKRPSKFKFIVLRGEERVMAKVDTILEEIKGLTLLEASDLVKKMEEAFGVSAAAATVVAAGGGAAAGGGGGPAGEKKGINLGLTAVGGHQNKR